MALQGWNPSQKNTAITLSGTNNVTAGITSSTIDCCAFGLNGVNSGKVYWETVLTYTTASNVNSGFGLSTSSTANSAWLGDSAGTCGYDPTNGNVSNNNGSLLTGVGTIVSGGTACFALDFTNLKVWFRSGFGNWNGSGLANPATNTGGTTLPAAFTTGAPLVFPGLQLHFTNQTITGHFTPASWIIGAPAGFVGFDPETRSARSWNTSYRRR